MAIKKYGVRTVDDNAPDPVTGNVNSSGTGGGSKFGKDDILAAENREFDAAGNSFTIKGASEFQFKGQEVEGFIDFDSSVSTCYLNGEISATKYVFIQDNAAPFVTLGAELTVRLSIDGAPTDVLFTGQALSELGGQIVLAADNIASTTRSCLGYYGMTTITDFKASVANATINTNSIAFFDGDNLKKGTLILPAAINSGTGGRFTKYNSTGTNIEDSSLSETNNEIIANKDVKINQDLETIGETVCDGGVDDKSGLRLKRLRNEQARPFDYALTEEFPWNMVYDSDGNLFVTNRTSKSISKILPDGSSSQFAYDADLGCIALAIDSSNNLYTNGSFNKIYKIDSSGVVSEFATVGSENHNMIFDSVGNLFVVCASSQELWKVTSTGVATLFHSFGTSGAGDIVPNRITIDDDDNLYITGFTSKYIYKVTPAGVVTNFYTPIDSGDGYSQGIIFNSFDNYIYGVNTSARITRLTLLGVRTILSDSMAVGSDTIAIDRNNNVYFASTPTSTPGNVFIFRQSNQEVEFYCEVNYPIRLVFNGENKMFACSATDDKVYIINPVRKKFLTLDSNGRIIFFDDGTVITDDQLNIEKVLSGGGFATQDRFIQIQNTSGSRYCFIDLSTMSIVYDTDAITIDRGREIRFSNVGGLGQSKLKADYSLGSIVDFILPPRLSGTKQLATMETTAPSSATANGVKGEIRMDADYIYICIETNTWKRSALTTW